MGRSRDELRSIVSKVRYKSAERRRVQRAVVAQSGRARTEYQSFKMNRPNNPITWAQFEEFIRREFGPSDPIDYYTRKLNTIRQGSQETISEYNSKFRDLLAKLQNVQEDRYPPRALVLYYVDGSALNSKKTWSAVRRKHWPQHMKRLN